MVWIRMTPIAQALQKQKFDLGMDDSHPTPIPIDQYALLRGNGKSASESLKRAQHNAIERARREVLSHKFTELAMLIPSLQAVKKPSKSAIVQRAIDHIQELHRKNDSMCMQVNTLKQSHDSLRTEVNKLRQVLNMPPLEEDPAISMIPTPSQTPRISALSRALTSSSNLVSRSLSPSGLDALNINDDDDLDDRLTTRSLSMNPHTADLNSAEQPTLLNGNLFTSLLHYSQY